MAIYHVRLEDPDSDEFRLVATVAESPEEARAIAEGQEAKYVGYTAPADELVEYEAQEKAGELSGRAKARLYAHRQRKPYKVKDVKGGGEDLSR